VFLSVTGVPGREVLVFRLLLCSPRITEDERYGLEVLTAVLLKIQVFWHGTLCRWASPRTWTAETLKMKAPWAIETSANSRPMANSHIPEDFKIIKLTPLNAA
jgi:hypothetical protein